MTPSDAITIIERLAIGLPPDDAGTRRLLERLAAHDDHEALLAALTLVGAEAVLDAERPNTAQ